MGFLDKAKGAAQKAAHQHGDKVKAAAQKAAHQHGDKVKDAADKTGGFIDEKTGGKHRAHIDAGTRKVHEAVDNLDAKNDDHP